MERARRWAQGCEVEKFVATETRAAPRAVKPALSNLSSFPSLQVLALTPEEFGRPSDV